MKKIKEIIKDKIDRIRILYICYMIRNGLLN